MHHPNLFFRRLHLYLGLLLIPWLLVYALSTVALNHTAQFRKFRAPDPQWRPLWEKTVAITAPATPDGVRDTARRLIADQGISGAFGARRQGQRLTINVQNFWHPRRLTYDFDTQQLRAEQKSFAWLDVLIRLHERTGYGQGGPLDNLWAALVDLFCVATLVWIGTGLYLWWKLAATRRWGFIALGGGLTTLLVLVLTL